MNNLGDKHNSEYKQAVTTTIFWVAGVTLAVIFLALFIGTTLDKVLHAKPLFTLTLTIASIPVTIISTMRIVKYTTKNIK